MTNRRRTLPLLFAALSLVLLVGCQDHGHGGGDGDHPAHADTDAASQQVEPAMAAGTHDVRCGCALAEVGHCGNYIEHEGEFVELVLPEANDLGKTPFCGGTDLVARVEGGLVDGKFVATSFEYTE